MGKEKNMIERGKKKKGALPRQSRKNRRNVMDPKRGGKGGAGWK